MPSPQAEGSVVLWLHDIAPSARAWCRRMVLAIGLVGVTMSWANALLWVVAHDIGSPLSAAIA